MVELWLIACLIGGACRDVSLLYDPAEMSLMTCLVSGQAQAALWTEGHPGWRVERWTCRIQDRRSARI